MKFTKMHGIGNDYVYVNAFEEKVSNPSELAITVSNRHFGIGSDGLILIKPSEVADCEMEMYNADGSKGEMCGNGIRCVAKYVYDNGICHNKEIKVLTGAGIKTLYITRGEDVAELIKVDMGSPVLTPKDIPARFNGDRMVNEPIEGTKYNGTAVSMGNPHLVIFMDEDVKGLDLNKIGPNFENNQMFPNRVNTEFVNVLSRDRLNMRVWERGSGETLACGTGACAVAVASYLNGHTDNKVTVGLLGGDLFIEYDTEKNTVYMTGEATTVFSGELLNY